MPKTIAWLALVFLAGCGSATAEQACTDLANTRCNMRMMCGPGTLQRIYGDMTTCLAREKLGCLNALAAPSTGNSPSATESCVAAYGSLGCADFLAGNPPSACVYSGSIATGAACAFNGQCSTTYCTNNTTAACGTCGMPTGSCTDTGCARGQQCVNDACVTPATLDSPCDPDHPCAADLSCVGAIMGQSGTCQQAVSNLGGNCSPGATDGAACDAKQELFCNTKSKVCQNIAYVGDGMPCGVLTDGSFAICLQSGTCVLAGTSKMGTCKAAAPDGGECNTATGVGCMPPAKCVISDSGTVGQCQVADATKC
jgi:hypothetical protein